MPAVTPAPDQKNFLKERSEFRSSVFHKASTCTQVIHRCLHTGAIDTSLPHGEMLFQIIGATAQWERSLIVERVRAELQQPHRHGKRLGRPSLRELEPEEIAKLRNERRRN
jgi:DNA invertase Pin-like site-specific DNA recombinase